jgi:hypothetical protein
MNPETITSPGSGLVFDNTYGSGVSTTFRNEIVAAENYLQSLFTNACTLTCNFDLQSLNPNFSAENFFSPITVSYSTFVNALRQHATTAPAIAAANSLSNLPDPTHGAGVEVSIGEARILGLAGAGSGTDDSVILNSIYWTASALQNNPGDAEAAIEHEITEGIMGRIGSLGIASSAWAPMDFFRFTASGQRDFTGGADGQPTYFSVDGSSVDTSLQFHSSVSTSGQFDGFDLADWNQFGADANDHDPFGPGGPGSGDPGTLSATDITLMEALGWDTAATTLSAPTVVGIGDFNKDGKSDILFDDNATVATWEMNGIQGLTRAVVDPQLPSAWQVVGTGDFNADGVTDILLRNSNGSVAVWLMNGTQIQTSTVIASPPATWHVAAVADFNGDGTSDILLQDTSGTVGVWFMSGGQLQSATVIASPPSSWRIAGTGDFSGDNGTDIVLQNTDGTIGVWEMNGAQIVSAAVIALPGATWRVLGTGDFSGDHISDIVLENSSGGVGVWEMNGTSIVSGTIIGSVTTDWHFVGIGDFNGDHTSDLLWQNNNGALQIWEMNGTQVTPGLVSPPAGAPTGGQGSGASAPGIQSANNGQFGGAEADITDLGAAHSPAPELSGFGSALSNSDSSVGGAADSPAPQLSSFAPSNIDSTVGGATHSPALQLSGSAPSNIDNTVGLFSQFMASAFGHSDFGASPTSLTGTNDAFQNQSPSLISPKPDNSHRT